MNVSTNNGPVELKGVDNLDERASLFIGSAIDLFPALLSKVLNSEFKSEPAAGIAAFDEYAKSVEDSHYFARSEVKLGDNLLRVALLFEKEYFPRVVSAFFGREIKQPEPGCDLCAELLNNLLGMIRREMERKSLALAAGFSSTIPEVCSFAPLKNLAANESAKIAWSLGSPQGSGKVSILVFVEKKGS